MYGRHDTERFLCPIRTVNIYRTMTPDGPYPVGNDIILRHPTPTVSTKKSVVALWIKKCIELSYEAARLDLDIINAHEVRAVAHSLSHHVGALLEEVCAGGRCSCSRAKLESSVKLPSNKKYV